MKNQIAILTCTTLLALSVGCGEAQAPPVVAAEAESSSASKMEKLRSTLSEEELKDIATYEHAMGNTHNMTPEQVVEVGRAMKDSPVFKNKFLGIWTVQTPSDAWVIMEIMYEVKPDLIIEAGTFHGGSSAMWAIILEHINPDGEIVTIDIEDQRERKAKELPIAKEKVEFLLGSSTDPKVVAQVHERAKGKKSVMVLLDSLHSKEHVAGELAAYAPLVTKNSYVIVQDTLLGPKAAIDEFLEASDTFVADRTRERYPDTNSVRGYLRRVK